MMIRQKLWKMFLSRTMGWVMWGFLLLVFAEQVHFKDCFGAFLSGMTLAIITASLSWNAEHNLRIREAKLRGEYVDDE